MQRTRHVGRGHGDGECFLSFAREFVGVEITRVFPFFIYFVLVIFGIVGFVELVHEIIFSLTYPILSLAVLVNQQDFLEV